MFNIHRFRLPNSLIKSATCLLLGCMPLLAQSATLPPAFGGTSEPDWTIRDYAWLTAVGRVAAAPIPALRAIDPDGQGWLRLTDAAVRQRGTAVYNHAFSSQDGVLAEFEYATWGGNGADGFSFYLLDGAVSNPTSGATGGSLGYASSGQGANRQNGVPGGYLGIGFDEFGNFSTLAAGGCPQPASAGPSCERTPNSIAVRGRDQSATGNGNGNYPLLARVQIPQGIGTGSRDGARRVRITMTPAPEILLTVEVQFNAGQGYQKLIDALNITQINGLPPETFKIGFSGSTGGQTNVHEVRFNGVQGARAASVTLDSTAPAMCGASPTTLTATVTGSDPAQAASGTVSFMIGTRVLAIAPVVNGVARAEVVLPNGSNQVVAQYSGDSVYGTVNSSGSAIDGAALCPASLDFGPTTPTQCGPITLSASLGGNAAQGIPTGTVTFYDGNVALAPVANIDRAGNASWTGALGNPEHAIRLNYSGDANYAATTAGPFQQAGNTPVCGTPTITPGDYSANTVAGQAVDIQIMHRDVSSDPENAPLAALPQQPSNPAHAPSNGTVVYSGTTVTYTPNPGFVGTDTFSYEVCTVIQAPYTSQGCAVVTVSVRVDAAVEPPELEPAPPKLVTPVPTTGIWSLAGLSMLLGLLALQRKRRTQR